MAFYDASLVLASAQNINTTEAGDTIYDVTGAGSGNAPAMSFGNATLPGADINSGDGMFHPGLFVKIGANGTGTGTIAIAIQAAPDNGSNAPGTYKTLASTAAIVGTDLDAGDVFFLPLPPYNAIKNAMGVPRFYRAYFTQTGDGACSSVTAILMSNPPTGFEGTQYANNFESA